MQGVRLSVDPELCSPQAGAVLRGSPFIAVGGTAHRRRESGIEQADGLPLQRGFHTQKLVRFRVDHAQLVDHEKQGLVRPVEQSRGQVLQNNIPRLYR